MGNQQLDCPTCVRLWRNYGEATRAHVTLLARLRGLEAADPPAAQELSQQVNRAAMRRDAARAEIEKHEAASHGQKTMRA